MSNVIAGSGITDSAIARAAAALRAPREVKELRAEDHDAAVDEQEADAQLAARVKELADGSRESKRRNDCAEPIGVADWHP